MVRRIDGADLFSLAMVALPLLIVALRVAAPSFLGDLVSAADLTKLPPGIASELRYVLAIPVGALVVVIVRLTLGLRVLGPFRPILIAVGLQMTGIVTGLAFLAATFLLIVAIRPLLVGNRLPYFARVSVLLSLVALFAILVVLGGKWFDLAALRDVARFPVVVLCLGAESFARTLSGEGVRSALWRGTATAITAVLITAIVGVPGVLNTLMTFPEFLIAEIGLIVLIARRFAFRALAPLNPKPKDPKPAKPRQRRKRRKGAKSRRNNPVPPSNMVKETES